MIVDKLEIKFGNLGEKLTEEEADQLVSGHEDSNGNINIADFVRTITS